MKHNKKRNTAFLYEALVKELTKCLVTKDEDKKNLILSILKEHFSKGKILSAELDLYRTVDETTGLTKRQAEKLLHEAKNDYNMLPKKLIFQEQSKVINKVNKEISPVVFNNFIPNYKNLATLSQIFNASVPLKERILLEEAVVDKISDATKQSEKELVPINNLVYKTFINKFNTKYGSALLKEQKELLTNYVLSFSDNGLSLKLFLNEELERITESISKLKETNLISANTMLSTKIDKILEKLELFRVKEFDQQMLSELLKVQYFVHEALKDDN
jgi:hypothetical protein